MATPEERFWAKVNRVDDEDSCWLWTAAVDKMTGYGRFWDGVRTVLPHRYAYELANLEIPAGLQIDHRHTCSKLCVRDSHLRPATNKQNNENLSGAKANSKTGVRGVSLCKATGRWIVFVRHNGKTIYGGRYVDIDDANQAAMGLRNQLFTHNDRDHVGL